MKRLPESVTGAKFDENMKVSKRVRHFLTEQRDRATTNSMDYETADTLEEKYPTLQIVSPELKKICALHLTHTLIESVPYLSSKYLSPDEQASIALKSFYFEFSAGETFREHPVHGRGIVIFRHGLGCAVRNCSGSSFSSFYWRKGIRGHPVDVDEVLVDDDFHKERQLVCHFAGFTKVFFIPRSVILEVLANNTAAWKKCAMWRYAVAAMILESMDLEKRPSARNLSADAEQV